MAGDIVYLIVYIHDILLIENNSIVLAKLILLLSSEFKLRNLDYIHYLLGNEVKSPSMRLMLTQQQYIFDILHGVGMSSCKCIDIPIYSSSSKLAMLSGDLYSNSTCYK
jgi:hypothetical protein